MSNHYYFSPFTRTFTRAFYKTEKYAIAPSAPVVESRSFNTTSAAHEINSTSPSDISEHTQKHEQKQFSFSPI